MFRKILLASAALAAIGTAAISFTATPAAANDGWRNYRPHYSHQNHWRPAVRYNNQHFGYRNYDSWGHNRHHNQWRPAVRFYNPYFGYGY